MLSKYQKQKLFYFLIKKSNSFLNLKKTRIEISKMAYDFNISNMTEEEKSYLDNNGSFINNLDNIDIYNIINNNDSYKKFNINIDYLYYRESLINFEYTDLDKKLEDDSEIDNIKSICNYWDISIHKNLDLDKNIIIPDLADGMNNLDYLLECGKNKTFDFSKWINLLMDYKNTRNTLKDKIHHLTNFLSLEFLNITELKSISPELYQILKTK